MMPFPGFPATARRRALQEMLAGGVHVVPCSLPEAQALIEAKKVKALAVMADQRAELFPEVPTLKELGINWTMGAWRGITVPKGTPPDVVAVLEKSIEKAVGNDSSRSL